MKHITLGVLAATTMAFGALAQTAYEDVVFDDYGAVEASLTGTDGNAENGLAVFSDKKQGNCVSCHMVATNETSFQGTVGPDLTEVGSYRSPAELRGILVDAKKTFEGTVMPAFYRTSGFTRPGDGFTGKAGTEPLPPLLDAQQIEDVVAYLATLGAE